MSYLVFDIETIGKPFDSFDDTSKNIFAEWAQRDTHTDEQAEAELEKIKMGLPLSPFLGEVVAISALDQDGKGGTYFQAPDATLKDFEDDGVQYRVGNEKELLERFWEVAKHYTTFVTFNGRGFDVPYLMIRAAVHGIRPTRDLMSNRYISMQRGVTHVDLSDQMTFYGALYPRPKLHFVAQAFGLTSSKGGGIDGKEVPQAFADKRYEEIARYCTDDVRVTGEVYERWNELLNFQQF